MALGDGLEQKSKASILRKCLEYLLTPIATFCTRHSIGFREFTNIAHKSFVNSAVAELEQSGNKVNVMKVSTITGINRKLISKYIKDSKVPISRLSISSRIVALWLQDSKYVDSKGRPKKITFKSSKSEFHKLVREVTSEISPKSILEHLLHTKVARICTSNDSGTPLLSLEKAAYDAGGNAEEIFKMLQLDINDMIYALEENINKQPSAPNLHMTTEADEISVEACEELREWVLEEGVLFHRRLRKKLAEYDNSFTRNSSSKSKETQSGNDFARIVVGTFSRVNKLNK